MQFKENDDVETGHEQVRIVEGLNKRILGWVCNVAVREGWMDGGGGDINIIKINYTTDEVVQDILPNLETIII